MASPIPVLPLVASMTVCPGFRLPLRSASSMTPSARRSLTDPIGLNASIFTYKLTCAGASFLIFTTGVWPIVSRMLSNLFLERSIGRLPLHRRTTGHLDPQYSAPGDAPQRCNLGRARRVQRVGFVGRTGMLRSHIAATHDLQPDRIERREQLRSWPQAQALRKVREDHPALTPRL